MTLRRLRWILLPGGVAAVLAVLALPPRPMPEQVTLASAALGLEGRQWRQDPEEAHYQAVGRAREHLVQRISAREHGAADLRASASPRALRSGVEPLVVVRDADVPDTAAHAWLRAAERELALVPRADAPSVPVVVALHTSGPVPFAGAMLSETLRDRFEYQAGATRACIVDIVFPRQPRSRERGRFEVPRGVSGGVLGRCALYARFGFPGRGAQRWAGLGRSWSGRWWWWYGDESMFVPHRVTRDTVRFRFVWGGVPWAELGCLRGRDDYCESLAGLEGGPRLPWEWSFGYDYGWGSQGTVDRVVADLILERGTARFARFWSSPLPADSALSEAYGVPAGALVRGAFSLRLVPAPTAQPGGAKLLVAGGWVILLGVLAMALSWRREMDL